MTDKFALVLNELNQVFSSSDFAGEEALLKELLTARQIVCVGAGRVGLAMAGFAKRLSHLGKSAFWIEDQILPRMGPGDLAMVGSGSGETKSVVAIAEIAMSKGLRLGLVTASRDSHLSALAHASVTLNCPSKNSGGTSVASVQPMTSLFEQSLSIYLDSIVLELMQLTPVTEKEMEQRHNVIE